jgi:reductive dehalogenase
MAVTLERGTDSANGGNGAAPLHFYDKLPNYGRSVRVVGEVQNVDMNQSPHPMNSRGELGPAAFNLQHNTISHDPFIRVSAPNHFADRRHFLTNVVNQASKGKTSSKRVEVKDAAAMARHIKAVAKYMGADIVTIAAAHPSFMYAGNRYVQDGTAEDAHEKDTPEQLCQRFPFLVFATTAWPYETLQAHRHHIGDSAYHVSQMKGNMILKSLEGYIKELGYTALRGVANPQATALSSGAGELGRNGLVISEKYGARVHMPDPIMTDLPLVADKPVDIGVSDFCGVCKKCAVTCPTNSITFDDRDPDNGKQLTRDVSGYGVYNGVQKFKINWKTCYALRPYTHEYWSSCLTCAAICPFTKPDKWWHTAAITWLKSTPHAMRPLVVKTLKAIDDKFWGTIKNKRVRWVGYDSGIKPGETACTVAGCTADHGAAAAKQVEGNVGYYYPLKENTNRFVKRA